MVQRLRSLICNSNNTLSTIILLILRELKYGSITMDVDTISIMFNLSFLGIGQTYISLFQSSINIYVINFCIHSHKDTLSFRRRQLNLSISFTYTACKIFTLKVKTLAVKNSGSTIKYGRTIQIRSTRPSFRNLCFKKVDMLINIINFRDKLRLLTFRIFGLCLS